MFIPKTPKLMTMMIYGDDENDTLQGNVDDDDVHEKKRIENPFRQRLLANPITGPSLGDRNST